MLRKRARQEDTDGEEGGEGGGLEVRGGSEMERERESSFSNCQSINHEKEPQGQTRQNTDLTNEILNYPTRSNVCMVQTHFHSETACSDAEKTALWPAAPQVQTGAPPAQQRGRCNNRRPGWPGTEAGP